MREKKEIKPNQKNTTPKEPSELKITHNSVQSRYINYSKATKKLLTDAYSCRNKTSTDRNEVIGIL